MRAEPKTRAFGGRWEGAEARERAGKPVQELQALAPFSIPQVEYGMPLRLKVSPLRVSPSGWQVEHLSVCPHLLWSRVALRRNNSPTLPIKEKMLSTIQQVKADREGLTPARSEIRMKARECESGHQKCLLQGL